MSTVQVPGTWRSPARSGVAMNEQARHEAAQHVLWSTGRGGYRPGSFTESLLEAWGKADPLNQSRLETAFPVLGEAIRLLNNQGEEALRAWGGEPAVVNKEIEQRVGVVTGQDEREVLAGILIEHTRMNIERCRCGWSDLGRSHARHVADALIAAGFHLTPATDDLDTTCRPHVFTPCECGDSDCREVVCVVCADRLRRIPATHLRENGGAE